MRKYFMVRFTYKKDEVFTIWYDSDATDINNIDYYDGFVLEGGKLLSSNDIDEIKAYATDHDITLEDQLDTFDLSNIMELINSVELTESCKELLVLC